MKKKNLFIILIVLLLTLTIVAIGIKFYRIDDENNKKDLNGSLENNKELEQGENYLENPITENEENNSNSQNQVSGGGSGGGGSSSVDNPEEDIEPPENSLPEDLYTQNCGLYFNNYGICTGSCLEGTCVSEGRSCYCKK